MSQMTQNAEKQAPVAIVGRSELFPVALEPRVFWPNLIGLNGLMAGLATGQWPFSEFFTANDLKRLKDFVMKSGILASGSLPAGGFEIPAEVLKISDVMPVVSLFLARQALDATSSFSNNKLSADRVKVVLESRFKSLLSASSADTASSESAGTDIAGFFARHFGFAVCPVNTSAPLPGIISWLGTAIRELQSGNADLVIAGSTDAVHSILEMTEDQPVDDETHLREGLGMIALRRLNDAQADGDRILCVISGCDASSIHFVNKKAAASKNAAPASAHILADAGRQTAGLAEQFARFARLQATDIVLDADGKCRNLPFNHLPEDGSNDATLDWKIVRGQLIGANGSRRFFHDLLGALFGTFVSRVVVQNPAAFAEVASGPLIFLANHQIGLESPLFMALAYAMTGLPIEAVAKPDHINAWLAFLLAFAQDSLGDGHPFRLMYSDRQNPQGLLDALKATGKREASLLVHVEGTRAAAAGQPVVRLSSVFLDMAIEKNLPLIPLRFVGGLPAEALTERLDFPFGNGKQDYIIGAPVMPEQLKKMPYGQRPRFLMDLINSLGPGKGEDLPLPADKNFVAKTRFFIDTFGFAKMQAMLFAILQMIDDPCEETAQLIKAVQSGKVNGPDVPPVLKSFLGHISSKFS